jgi:hypothetical protein
MLVASVSVDAQVADSLRGQARIRETLLAGQIRDMAELREELRESWARLEQQSGGLLRAQSEGETVDSHCMQHVGNHGFTRMARRTS